MASQTNALIVRAERKSQSLRPATLIYATQEIPCTSGNLEFFERLRADGGGFQSFNGQHVRILREDMPNYVDGSGNEVPIVFKRGQAVTVRNDDPDCPNPGETYSLIVGQNNSQQSLVIILNLESLPA